MEIRDLDSAAAIPAASRLTGSLIEFLENRRPPFCSHVSWPTPAAWDLTWMRSYSPILESKAFFDLSPSVCGVVAVDLCTTRPQVGR